MDSESIHNSILPTPLESEIGAPIAEASEERDAIEVLFEEKGYNPAVELIQVDRAVDELIAEIETELIGMPEAAIPAKLKAYDLKLKAIREGMSYRYGKRKSIGADLGSGNTFQFQVIQYADGENGRSKKLEEFRKQHGKDFC